MGRSILGWEASTIFVLFYAKTDAKASDEGWVEIIKASSLTEDYSNEVFSSEEIKAINYNGTLSFTATGTGTNDYDNQIRFTGLSIVNGATYKLTFKIRSSVSDSTGLTIAFDDPSDNYSWCGEFNDNTSKLMLNDSGNFTEVTLTTTATKDVANGRLFINLGHLGACTIEIDDLKLVRTNW